MASSPKSTNGNAPNNNGNGPLGKRKRSRSNKGSYLSKWLDKTMQHIQEATPSMDTYDTYIPSMNWPNTSQFAPGYDPCRYNMYGCTPEPMSLPTLPTYYNGNHMYNPDYRYMQHKSVQVQRPRRRRSEHKAEEVHSTPNATPNGTLSYLQPKNFTDNQDYASLPPIVTSVGDTNSNSDVNTNEKDDGSNNRRYSDPCVRGLPDVARPTNGEVDSASDSGSDLSGSQVGSRLLTCLLDQIASLKMANERLNKELMDTRAELDAFRQQTIFHKGSSSSIGATPNHSPLNSNGMIGGQYGPGFVTDVVREIREAARAREEALYSRVRAMLMDRTDNSLASPEAKSAEKSLEEIKSSLRASEADKRRMMDRIIKLEDELRLLRVTNGLESSVTNGNMEDAETERLRLRKDVADMRKAKQNAEDHALK
ncbi:uncharacterized protein LOC126375135 isoform X2 [Pectinophora gossypiella]|nr:uncharacterized protein LOC126375135 isoform X2 [Pectinophora gossypiella]XP_049877942.1 uncharacterized protein LOC126375135 isoform X2 [Pectinophora gossypiella]XP_049877943.1 uncharacterized protein LOC126375135 isoform X2 [Pectinophora gossypiella]